MRITTTNPGAVHMTTREISDTCLSCDCPNLIEVKLKIKACKCKKSRPSTNGANVAAKEKMNDFADKICECLRRSKSRSNFLKIDFVDGHLSDPESCENGEEKRRRNVLVLKLRDLDVKCENGLRHELYFPASSVPGKLLSQGDCLAYSMSSTGEIHEHKPIPVPEELTKTDAISEEKPKQVRKPVERQMSKSMDDVKKDKAERPLKSRSAQNVTDKGRVTGGGGGATGREDNSMSDMDSIELIIISDEFLNESQNQEVIIVNEEKKQKRSSPTRSKSFQIKKNFLHDSRTNGGGGGRGDYFKRAAEAKAKAAQMACAAGTGGKRLVIISDEYKRKSLESTVRIVKSKEKLSTKTGSSTGGGRKSLAGMAKSKTISNAMVDLNSKIISCVLQSYEEPDSLENKALEAKLLQEQLAGKARMVHCGGVAQIMTPNK